MNYANVLGGKKKEEKKASTQFWSLHRPQIRFKSPSSVIVPLYMCCHVSLFMTLHLERVFRSWGVCDEEGK